MWINEDFLMRDRLKVICLNANKDLAFKIAKLIDVEILPTEVTTFADGEISFIGKKSFRGDNIYIIQSTCSPVADRLMELLLCIDACKRSSASTITCVIPYFGYSRQERRTKPRQPISASLVAKMIQIAGADRVVSVDLHAMQIAGFFDIPVDDISAVPLFCKYFKSLNLKNIVCVSPDHGGLVRTVKLAEKLNAPVAIIDKRRPEPNKAEIFSIVGDIKDKNCIIVDDIVDTAGTLLAAANKLVELGAKKVYAAITHGVLSRDASERIKNSKLEKLIITDSIPLSPEKRNSKIEVLSLDQLLSEVIDTIENGTSLYDTLEKFDKAQLGEK